MEKVGVHKREILVDRVEEARDTQEETKEQFKSALEAFSSLTGFEGGDLEDKYTELSNVLEDSEDKADELHKRIEAIEDVSTALFREWEAELDEYSSANLRRSSARQLEDTRTHYKQLIGAMRKAESKIEPVLQPLRDQVLYLKHNLNARAIASLQHDLQDIRTDVSSLIRDLEDAVAEANRFIASMEQG
jgi:septation ring formation regulator EzrA